MNWLRPLQNHFSELLTAWDRFWFSPTDPATLSFIRFITGALLLWTHLIWSFDLMSFIGPDGWIEPSLRAAMGHERWTFSLFNYMGPTWLIWIVHIINLIVYLMLMLGLFSRATAVWAFIATISYASYTTPGAFFGLEKINCLLTMYLMIGPCGACYSLDSWLRNRKEQPPVGPSVMANFAIRLIQLHLCVVYFFSGFGKVTGNLWRNGGATWFTVANVEYRSLNMTWLADHLWLVDLLTHTTLLWELLYCCLVWNRLARPWVLLTAIGMHGFIAFALGMPEFALAMLIANAAFIAPTTIRWAMSPIANRLGL